MNIDTVVPGEVDATGEVEKKALDVDDARLLAMGKRPELRRVYNTWTLCAYQVMLMASWSCLVVLYSTVFDVGGPVSLIWGTFIVAIGQTLLMASLAEYCGIWPTAGGQQYYTQVLSTGSTRPVLSYLVGWAIMIIASFVQIANPGTEWKSWMTWLLYSGLLVGPVVANLNQKWLPGVNLLGAIWVVGGGLAWAVVFIVMAPKHDAKLIFTEFINNSGYTSSGWVFIMSFYNAMYGLVGTDGTMHLVEEMKDPSKNAPRSIIYSMIFCGIISWLTAILLIWTAGDWNIYISSPQPYMSWWMGVTGSLYGGGLFCALVMIGINFFVIVGTNSAGSRIVWSMARDGGLPYSAYLSHVSPRLGIPLRAIGFVVIIDLLLGLIVLGSDLAFQSIISGGGLMLQVSYLVPVIVVLIRSRDILPPRPHFDLGRWGYLVNVLSVCWSLLICAVYLCPLYVPVTIDAIANMNWSCLIVGATILFPGVYWILRARFRYIKEHNSVIEEAVVLADG